MRFGGNPCRIFRVSSVVRREDSLSHLGTVLVLAVVLAVASLAISRRVIAEETQSEYGLKAAFVFNFLKFTEFPGRVDGSIYICVFGDAEVFESFESLRGRQMYDRSLVVERFKSTSGVSLCDVVFVAVSSPRPFRELLRAFEDRPVLLVGEEEGFLGAGGVVRFFMQDGKIRFRIYPKQAQQRGLKLSSKLLALADIKTD